MNGPARDTAPRRSSAVALPAVALLVLLPLMEQPAGGAAMRSPVPAPAVAAPRPTPAFDPAATTSTWHGDTALVQFLERGLTPGETVQISVTVAVSLSWSCIDRAGLVLLRSSSAAASETEQAYTADPDGLVAAAVSLEVRVGHVELTGLPCELRAFRTTETTVEDRTHGVSLQLTG